MSVVIETTIGDLTIDLFTDERPVACLNFMKLCKLKYYNYNLFHTIEQGFIAQTGDPSGAGDGGSSIWGVVEGNKKRFFEAESLPKINHNTIGLLSMVGAGKHLAGSQFFFTLGESLTSLDGRHCVIGEVVEGHDVLRKLNEAIVDENFRPYQDIRITHTVILEDPFPDPRGFREPSHSPSPSAERLKNGRIAADEDIDDTEGKTMEEIQEMLAEREAKARATILEIVGDLPDAEVAPPENVLFVCKLNPVTTDDDLEIIFSRFGKVKGCEVIRDRKTGDSLQYAFIEFEEQKSCEAAYFKMDNVLIDDRRIHVDFSQSVSKVKWRGKGRGIEGDSKGLDFDNIRNKGEKSSSKVISDPKKDANSNSVRKTKGRSRYRLSRSPSQERKYTKDYYRRTEQPRKKSKSPHRSYRRDDSNVNRSTNRKREYSEKQRYSSRYDLERNTRHSPQRNDIRSLDKNYLHNRGADRKRVYHSPDCSMESRSKTHKKYKKSPPKKKTKKSKIDMSSSDDSDTTSSSSETSSSESSSSKEESKKKKIKKNKKIKMKSKKHKK